jgi:hypothetical protein
MIVERSLKYAPDPSGFRKGKGMIHSIISKVLLWFSAVVLGVGAIFLILAVRRSTLPYNSEGNYFDGVVNYHEQSIAVYGVLSGAFFLCAIMLFAIRLFFQRSRRVALSKSPTFVEPTS